MHVGGDRRRPARVAPLRAAYAGSRAPWGRSGSSRSLQGSSSARRRPTNAAAGFVVNTKRAKGCADLLNVICDLRSDWRATSVGTAKDDVVWVRGTDDFAQDDGEGSSARYSRIVELRPLCTKAGLARLMHAEVFHPTTYILPEEEVPEAAWGPSGLVFKPDRGSQGSGIAILFSAADLRARLEETTGEGDGLQPPGTCVVVQRLVDRPHLFEGGFKWDCRIYALILSAEPPRAFVSREGLVRVCTEAWAAANPDAPPRMAAQLTNYSISKHEAAYTYSDDPDDGDRGTKRTLSATLDALARQGVDADAMWRAIQHIVARTTSAMLRTLRRRSQDQDQDTVVRGQRPSSCFHLLGFDILFDADLHAHLLEVNYSPSWDICSVYPLGDGAVQPTWDHQTDHQTAHADLVLGASVAMGRRAEKRCTCAAHHKTHVHRPCAVDLVAKRAAVEGALTIVQRDAAAAAASRSSNNNDDTAAATLADLAKGTAFTPCALDADLTTADSTMALDDIVMPPSS